MKKVIVWCLLACLMIGLASCKESGPEEVMGEIISETYVLNDLCLCVKNSEDKDLVKAIPLTNWTPRDKTADQAIYGTFAFDDYSCSLSDVERIDALFPLNMVKSLSGDWLVEQRIVSSLPFNNKKSISIITFPGLFGDGNQHILKAVWDVPSNNTDGVQYAECKRVEFDGKEITNIVYTDHPYYFHEKCNIVTITLP